MTDVRVPSPLRPFRVELTPFAEDLMTETPPPAHKSKSHRSKRDSGGRLTDSSSSTLTPTPGAPSDPEAPVVKQHRKKHSKRTLDMSTGSLQDVTTAFSDEKKRLRRAKKKIERLKKELEELTERSKDHETSLEAEKQKLESEREALRLSTEEQRVAFQREREEMERQQAVKEQEMSMREMIMKQELSDIHKEQERQRRESTKALEQNKMILKRAEENFTQLQRQHHEALMENHRLKEQHTAFQHVSYDLEQQSLFHSTFRSNMLPSSSSPSSSSSASFISTFLDPDPPAEMRSNFPAILLGQYNSIVELASRLYPTLGPQSAAAAKTTTFHAREPSPTPAAVTFSFCTRSTAQKVCLAGEFSNWKPLEMTRLPHTFNGSLIRYQIRVGLVTNNQYQYKYIVDGIWTIDQDQPTVTTPEGTLNNLLRLSARESAHLSFSPPSSLQPPPLPSSSLSVQQSSRSPRPTRRPHK